MRLFLLLISFFLFFSSCTETKQNITFQSENIMIEQEIISDSTIVLKYLPYKDSIENSKMNKPLAFSPKNYDKNDGVLNSSLGNLFADATYLMSKEYFSEKIDVVLLNHGGIRSIISAGEISEKTAFELMPFENSIIIVKLKGKSIKKMIEYLISAKLPHPLKGLNIILNNDYSLSRATINEKFIEDDKIYNIATTDYLLKGGDKMYFFKDSISTIDINYKMRDVLIDYFKSIDTLKINTDNRFIIR
mgnify:FL=1